MINRFWFRSLSYLLLLFTSLAICSCTQSGMESEIITAENKETLLDQAKTELTFDEMERLSAYLEEKQEYAYGKTIGDILEETQPISSEEGSEQAEVTADLSETAEESGLPGAGDTETASQLAESAPPQPVEPSEPPPPTTAVLSEGTTFKVRLGEALSSKTNSNGQRFETQLENDLIVDGQRLARSGDVVLGRLSNVKASGKVKGRATMALTLTEIRTEEGNFDINTNTLRFEAEKSTGRDAKRIGIAAGVGTVIGAIAGGGKGAAIGAAVGGGAGTGATLLTSGDEVEFQVEQLFEFQLTDPVEMKILE